MYPSELIPVKGSEFWLYYIKLVLTGRHLLAFGHAYLEELVGGFLVLLGHGVWCRLGEGSDESEEGDRGTDTDGDTPSNAGIGTWRVGSAGSMGTEGNPVGC